MTRRPTPRPGPTRPMPFADRVMASVAREPRPTPARVFMRSVVRLRMGAALATMATAWHLTFARGGTIPLLVRAQSLVVLLVFTAAVTTGSTLAAAGVVRVIDEMQEPDRVVAPALVPHTGPPRVPHVSPQSKRSPEPRDDGAPPRQEGAQSKGEGTGEGDRQRSTKNKSGSGSQQPRKDTIDRQGPQTPKATPKPQSQRQSGGGSGADDSKAREAPAPQATAPSSGDGDKATERSDSRSGPGS